MRCLITIASAALARQVMRSGTSPSANYRAACIAKSEKDFVNKLKIVEEEIDETAHWLDIIMETEMLPKSRVQPLQECSELLSITVAAIVSTKKSINTE